MSKETKGIIGKRIAISRRYQGLTQKTVAEGVGISVREFRRIEKGEVTISLDLVETLAEKFGFEPFFLCSGRTTCDILLKRALQVIPNDLLEEEYSEVFRAVYGSECSEDDEGSPDLRKILEELNDLILYGYDHYSDEVLREERDISIFTQMYISAAPKRVKRGSKREIGDVTDEMIRNIYDINNYQEWYGTQKVAE